MNLERNTLFYGDNLDILRAYIPDESVDLIYLDPPFNSNRSYNVLFKDESGREAEAQITAFDDTWHWGAAAEHTYHDLVQNAPLNVVKAIEAFRQIIGSNQMMAYLVMMTARLVELRRVLKPSGSLYLHCDPTASHYLKILLDTIFGVQNYRNEIIWKRTSSHSDAKRFPKITDTLLFYTRSDNFTWNKLFGGYDESYLKTHYNNIESDGRRFQYGDLVKPKGSIGYFYTLLGCPPPPNGWRMPEEKARQWIEEGRIEIPPKGKIPRYKRYLDEMEGTVIGNLWADIPPVNSQARDYLGYPTQKPLALLERILQASSNPGDLVLDPFSGCGTAVAAAQKLGRRWIGIDITHLAISMHKLRLRDMFGLEPGRDYDVIGEPKDLAGARQLARENRYQFQWWALSELHARPYGGQSGERKGKKGSDTGIDGVIIFQEDARKTAQIILQVKSGKVTSAHIRDLRGVVEREGAAIGVFITLEPPTQEMLKEALASGYYHSELWGKDYPRIQILTIEDILNGKGIEMPPIQQVSQTFKKAPRARRAAADRQLDLLEGN